MKNTVFEVMKGQRIQNNNNEISKIKMEEEWRNLFRDRVEEAKYLKRKEAKK